MATTLREEVTHILERICAGDEDAKGRLVTLVYDDLRRVAAGLMKKERVDHTLQSTALVHEALLRLLDGEALGEAPNRRFLFAAASRAMREVLVDHARARGRAKRGGGRRRQPLDDVLDYFVREQNLDMVALHEALEILATLNERQSQVVELRFFGGMHVREIAEQLGVSVATVESDFRIARAWLRRRLDEGI